MDKNKLLARLEQDLSHFLITEICRNDPSKRGTSEMYRYKGLSITTNEKAKGVDKIAAIRIGVLEAHFKIETGDKTFGNLMPDDERFVQMWMTQSENVAMFKKIFSEALAGQKVMAIIPFDLEEYYTKI